MQFGYRDVCLEHETGARHPESADRLRAIRRTLAKEHGVSYVDADPAGRAALERVHDPAYVDAVADFCEAGGGSWDADTVGVEATWDAACTAAGLAVWAAEAALDGADGRETPFAAGRPPGHHAEPDEAMGFCFFNNVAIAAEAALEREDVQRVAIFDWDVHHGNGTQEAFSDRGDVFYASVHERGLFPGTGDVQETGEGAGEGTTLNVKYPGGAGDSDYLAAVDRALAPSLRAFDPDLLLVSAGFDAHRNDPISRMRVTTEGFGGLATRLRELADDCEAALAFVLEGGYGLEALAESVRTINTVFDGYDPETAEEDPGSQAQDVLDDVCEIHGLA